jgi:hypothetical protein
MTLETLSWQELYEIAYLVVSSEVAVWATSFLITFCSTLLLISFLALFVTPSGSSI